MSVAPATQRPAAIEDEECLTCRLIGTGVFAGLGVRGIIEARKASEALAAGKAGFRGAPMLWRLASYGCLAAAAYRFSKKDLKVAT